MNENQQEIMTSGYVDYKSTCNDYGGTLTVTSNDDSEEIQRLRKKIRKLKKKNKKLKRRLELYEL